MFLQRLTIDHRTNGAGFQYDYMGAAEYEFGATRNARIALAASFLDGKLASKRTNFVEMYDWMAGKDVDVVVLGLKSRVDGIGQNFNVASSKEAFRTGNDNIVAWMNVSPRGVCEPLLIIRTSVTDLGQRVETFLKDFVELEKGRRAYEASLDFDSNQSAAWQTGWEEASDRSTHA